MLKGLCCHETSQLLFPQAMGVCTQVGRGLGTRLGIDILMRIGTTLNLWYLHPVLQNLTQHQFEPSFLDKK